MTETKHCRKCGCDKPADREHWYFNKGKPNAPCISCRLKHQHGRYRTDPDYRISVCQYQHKRRRNPVIKAARREFDKKRDEERLRDPEFKAWRRQYGLEYSRKRYHNDPKTNIDRRIQSGICKSLRKKGAHKTSPKANILGWTIDELMVHLDALFEDGMSWDNTDEWHIDHIIPLSAVNYVSENDPLFKMVWALDNLAPLWAADNQKKLANIEWSLPIHYKNPKLRALYENRDEFLLIFG